MTSAVEDVRAQVDQQCLAQEMDKNGCAVRLDQAPKPFILIDLDHQAAPVKRSSRKCDYLFFASEGTAGLWVVPVELKSTAVNANTASRQLQAGAKIAEGLVPGKSPVRFVPVVARGRKGHRKQYQELAKKRVMFRNERHAIEVIDCGTSLYVGDLE